MFFLEVEFKQSRHLTTALASMKVNHMWAGHPDEVFEEAVHCDDATWYAVFLTVVLCDFY